MKTELFLTGQMWIVGSAVTSKSTGSYFVMLLTGIGFIVASFFAH